MRISLAKSEIKGKVKAPSSKSYTIRGLICAALAVGTSHIIYPLSADDTEAASGVLQQIGVNIEKRPEVWQVSGGNFRPPAGDLYCGDSAATLRFMMAVCSQVPGQCRLTAGKSLAQRPVKALLEALRQLGVACSANGDLPPVTVQGGTLKGGVTGLPGDISSQYVSALLMIAPLAGVPVHIALTTPLESKPYVEMTLECLAQFGVQVGSLFDFTHYEISPQPYRPARYVVEGDWTSASYFLALGAAAGEITLTNLNPRSLQGDRVLLEHLRWMGATVAVKQESISVRYNGLKAITADLTDCIDLLPTLAVLAALADGTSVFTGINRARLKESNRVAAMREGLERLGIPVREEEKQITITGAPRRGAIVDAKGDHRIAMAFSVLGVASGDVTIEGAECVSKTFPQFWAILEGIGGKVKLREAG